MSDLLLSEAVAKVESSGNPYAMRYEPAWLVNGTTVDLIAQHATGGWIDTATAAVIGKTSWGAYQIMGSNLWGEMGYDGRLVDFLTSKLEQLLIFKQFIAKAGFNDGPLNSMDLAELNRFAIYYNGDILYAQSLLKAV